jgi:hypothetical protein
MNSPGPFDPPPERTLGEARTSARRALLLREITRDAVAVPGRSRRGVLRYRGRVSLAAVCLTSVAVLGAFLVVVQEHRGARERYAATPVMLTYRLDADRRPAADVLDDLARTAERATPAASGRYEYQKVLTWALLTSVTREGSDSSLVPSVRETWRGTDGTGLSRSTADGRTTSGRLSPSSVRYSTDPETLATQLAAGHPTGLGPAERFTAVVDLYLDRVPDPALRATILKVLAGERGLENRGTVTDRAGRTGVAISIDSGPGGLPTRYTLIFDPGTGMLLDSEQMLTTTAGELHVRIPSVIEYQVWAARGQVDEPGNLP